MMKYLLDIDFAADLSLPLTCFRYCLPTFALSFVSSSHKLICASSLPKLSDSIDIVLSMLSRVFWSCFKADTTLLKYLSLLLPKSLRPFSKILRPWLSLEEQKYKLSLQDAYKLSIPPMMHFEQVRINIGNQKETMRRKDYVYVLKHLNTLHL